MHVRTHGTTVAEHFFLPAFFVAFVALLLSFILIIITSRLPFSCVYRGYVLRISEQREYQIVQDDIERKQRRAQRRTLEGAPAADKGKDEGGTEKLDMVPPEEALETVAMGVVVRGVLSVMDESGYRRASVTAGTGIDPLEGLGGAEGTAESGGHGRMRADGVEALDE